VFRDLVTALLVPPGNLALLALAGLALGRRYPRTGRGLAACCLCLLLVAGLPVTADALLASLGQGVTPAGPAPAAIVILGADVNRAGREEAEAEPGSLTLERLRAGAALYRRVRLPVLVTGGTLRPDAVPVGEVMARSLSEDFGVPVRWTERDSRNTWENARDSAILLRKAGIGSAYIVTHPWHMRRALIAFARFGIAAVPAPTRPHAGLEINYGSFLPEPRAWLDSYFAFHEWIGCAWYALRARIA
jgi:uncharacterized SAM-binding protein YcdF (DUF218 family)